MIPLPPTRLQLGADDILEYENMKRTWEKRIKAEERRPVVDDKAMRKKEVQDRIGLTAPCKK